MKLNRIILSLSIIFSCLIMVSITPVSANNKNEIHFNENKNLSDEEITSRFTEINSSYKVGEPFSEVDAEFVNTYLPEQSLTRASGNQTVTGSDAALFYGTFFWSMFVKDWTYNHCNFGSNLKFDTTALVSKIIKRVSFEQTMTVYGVVSGLQTGITYQKALSSNVENSSGSKTEFSANLYQNAVYLSGSQYYSHVTCTITTSDKTIYLYSK